MGAVVDGSMGSVLGGGLGAAAGDEKDREKEYG